MEDYQAGSERGPEERKRPWWKTDWEKLNIWQVVQISGLLLVILFISFIVWGFILAGPSGFLWSKTELKPLIVTTSLTTTGGVGAVALMVINYQKQKYTEHQFELETTKFSEEQLAQEKLDYARYVEMLSKENPAVVLSGIQGISNYADALALRNDLRAEEAKQECASILCALIRSEGNAPEARRNNAAQNQFEALRVIKAHLLNLESPTSWATLNFDLHEVNFLCPVHIEDANFNGSLVLWKSVFHRSVYAAGAHFNNANFNAVTFEGTRTQFNNVTFENVSFAGSCTFEGDVNFSNATFTKNVAFAGDEHYAGHATFGGKTHFSRTKFLGETNFRKAIFKNYAWFNEAEFQGQTDFTYSHFLGKTFFNSTYFGGITFFDNAKFESETSFQSTQFIKDTSFNEISFKKCLIFYSVIAQDLFSFTLINCPRAGVNFSGASFKQLDLENSIFLPLSEEDSYTITGDEKDFSKAQIHELRATGGSKGLSEES